MSIAELPPMSTDLTTGPVEEPEGTEEDAARMRAQIARQAEAWTYVGMRTILWGDIQFDPNDNYLRPRPPDEAYIHKLVRDLRQGDNLLKPVPLTVEDGTYKLVDGAARYLAHRIHLKDKGFMMLPVKVALYTYHRDGARMAHAAQINNRNGQKLTFLDRQRVSIALDLAGWETREISYITRLDNLTIEGMVTRKVEIASITNNIEAFAIRQNPPPPALNPKYFMTRKRGLPDDLDGQQVSAAEAAAIARAPASYTLIARQLLEGLQYDWLPEESETMIRHLLTLEQEIPRWLRSKGY